VADLYILYTAADYTGTPFATSPDLNNYCLAGICPASHSMAIAHTKCPSSMAHAYTTALFSSAHDYTSALYSMAHAYTTALSSYANGHTNALLSSHTHAYITAFGNLWQRQLCEASPRH
jgi:hypothetical protein